MTTAVLTNEETLNTTLNTTELAEGYNSYTNVNELTNANVTDALAEAMPTTTVVTTSAFCGADE